MGPDSLGPQVTGARLRRVGAGGKRAPGKGGWADGDAVGGGEQSSGGDGNRGTSPGNGALAVTGPGTPAAAADAAPAPGQVLFIPKRKI